MPVSDERLEAKRLHDAALALWDAEVSDRDTAAPMSDLIDAISAYAPFAQLTAAEEHDATEWLAAVHGWFELSYAHYLTVPRSILEAMPPAWQARFVSLMEELDTTFDWRPARGRYMVELRIRDEDDEEDEGVAIPDPLMQYRHPNHIHIEALRKRPPEPKTEEQ